MEGILVELLFVQQIRIPNLFQTYYMASVL